jgi:methylated-DNA-[protein]-cysteine S-methyltransferase
VKKKRREEAGTCFSVYATPSGFGGVVASSEGLVEVFLPVSDTVEEMKSHIARLYPKAAGENTLTGKAAEMLRKYFSGQKVSFDLPLDLEDCTEFRRTVYKAVSRIPYGSVRTYAEVAAEIKSPKASRGIGSAMAGNPVPIIIPCHRVIGSDGKMTGYSAPGGTDMKAKLLRMEGVRFEKGEKKVKR